jgi:hypothetical protein
MLLKNETDSSAALSLYAALQQATAHGFKLMAASVCHASGIGFGYILAVDADACLPSLVAFAPGDSSVPAAVSFAHCVAALLQIYLNTIVTSFKWILFFWQR